MSKWKRTTVAGLVFDGTIDPPMDGNHGEIHPKGDDFTSEGIPFVMASDVSDGIVDLKSCKFIAQEQADGLRKGFSLTGDVLLTHKASIGRTAIVPPLDTPYIMLTPQVTYYRVKKYNSLDPTFLRYYFDSAPFQETMGRWAGSGSTRAYIGITAQRNLPIRYPCDIEEQRRIAGVLGSLDHKIKINNRINAELEAMAKMLYDYWFVQFDFPDKNGKPFKFSGGKMVYNAKLKREIPDGWTDGTLESLGQIVGGSTPSTADDTNFCTNGTPWITPKDLSDNKGNTFIAKGAQSVSSSGIKSASLKIYPNGTVLLSSRAPIGYTAIASNDLTTNQGFKSFIPNRGYGSEYIYQCINASMKSIVQAASGSTFKEISGGTLKSVKTVLPGTEICARYCALVKSNFQMRQNNETQNRELAQLRDWLLPMLMNGQVTVK